MIYSGGRQGWKCGSGYVKGALGYLYCHELIQKHLERSLHLHSLYKLNSVLVKKTFCTGTNEIIQKTKEKNGSL